MYSPVPVSYVSNVPVRLPISNSQLNTALLSSANVAVNSIVVLDGMEGAFEIAYTAMFPPKFPGNVPPPIKTQEPPVGAAIAGTESSPQAAPQTHSSKLPSVVSLEKCGVPFEEVNGPDELLRFHPPVLY
jgi:hypothetical protein